MTGHTITIRTDPTIFEQIAALADAMERSRNWVIEDALKQYIDTQSWQVEGIKAAMESLDRGEGLSHAEVVSDMEALIRS